MYIFILRALNVAARFFKMCSLGYVCAFSHLICSARILVWGCAYSTRPARILVSWRAFSPSAARILVCSRAKKEKFLTRILVLCALAHFSTRARARAQSAF